MERLISSSSLFPSRAPLPSLPRLVVLHRPAASRLRPPPLPRRFALAAAFQHEGPRPPNSRSSRSASSVSLSDEKARSHHPTSALAGGRDLMTLLLQKVASAFVLVSFSVLIVSAVQTLLAAPAHATVQSAAKTGGRFLRTEFLSSAWTGFFAGCLHTLSGPDHLAALAPLSIGRTRLESAVVGALWGCGHDAGQVIFGLLFLLLKDRLHIEVIRTWGTRVVGLTLLVIGALGIREASEVPTPCVALQNGECDASIIDHLDATLTGKKKIGFATFATGIVHGLQPDALMMVLPALALPSRLAGAAFLGDPEDQCSVILSVALVGFAQGLQESIWYSLDLYSRRATLFRKILKKKNHFYHCSLLLVFICTKTIFTCRFLGTTHLLCEQRKSKI